MDSMFFDLHCQKPIVIRNNHVGKCLSIHLRQLSLVPPKRLADVEAYLQALVKETSEYVPANAQFKPRFGSAKDKYILSPDFDAPLDDFKEYMQ
jgi:hypothetical protein